MKQKLPWVLAALAIIALMGLSGAYFKGQERIQALTESEQRLKKQLQAPECPTPATDTSGAEERAALEALLAESQEAQRALTEQLRALEAAAPPAAAPKGTITRAEDAGSSSPFPAYLALRREVLSGENFKSEWYLLLQEMPDIPEPIRRVVSKNTGGIATRAELRDALGEALKQAEARAQAEAAASSDWQAGLAPYLSIRKIDESDPLPAAIENDDLDEAAEILMQTPRKGYEAWLAQYKNRRAVLQALNAIESQLLTQEEAP